MTPFCFSKGPSISIFSSSDFTIVNSMLIEWVIHIYHFFFVDPFSDPLDSYDPCSPTASPELAMDDGDNLLNSSSSSR